MRVLWYTETVKSRKGYVNMIKKIMVIIGAAFLMIVGGSTLNSVSANTTTVKVEVVSRNIENHTIEVKTDDRNSDEFTLREVSAAQMDVANKGSIIKVTYDDEFNLLSIKKVRNFDLLIMLVMFPFILLAVFCALAANAPNDK